MAQRLRVPTRFQRTRVQFPGFTYRGSQLPETPASDAPMPFAGLLGHMYLLVYTQIHAMKNKNLLKKEDAISDSFVNM